MVGPTAREIRPRGLRHLGRIERSPHSAAPETPRPKRSPAARLLRLSILAAFLGLAAGITWLLHMRVVGVATVEGDIVTFTAPAPVIVEEVYVHPGQWCEKGQALARLAADEAGETRALLECQLAEARLRLELVQCGGVLGDWQLGKRLDERDDLATGIAAAEARVTSAEATLAHAKREHAICASLTTGGQASSRELDAAATAALTAAADLARTRAEFEGLRTRWVRERELAPAGSQGSELRRLELALLEGSVREAEQRLRQFDWQSGTRTLVAPFAGRVDRVYVAAGSVRRDGEPLLTIYDPTSLRVVAYLPPEDREAWSVGTQVQAFPNGSSQPISGVVSEVHRGWAAVPPILQKVPGRHQIAVPLSITCTPARREHLAPSMVLKVVGTKE